MDHLHAKRMSALRCFGIAAAIFSLSIADARAQQTLYAASVRPLSAGDAETLAGGLYAVDLASGSAKFLTRIRLEGAKPTGLTGLAAHPDTGVFYAITSPLSDRTQSLVTLDPFTGYAKRIGPLRHAASDIAFSGAGELYAWLYETSQLGVIDLATGATTPLGPAHSRGPPGGLAIDSRKVAYVTPTGATGTLDTVDLGTGAVIKGPQLTGAPFEAVINSLTFTPSGLLLAVNSNAGSPAVARLATINTSTGAVSSIGNLPDDSDALTFSPAPAREEGDFAMSRQKASFLALGIFALIFAVYGLASRRRG